MATRRNPAAEPAPYGKKPAPPAQALPTDSAASSADHDDQFEMRSQRVFEVMREIRRVSYQHLYEDLYGKGDEELEPAQHDALEMLLTESEWRMTDFAHALRVKPSTATRMVERLVNAGVATR